MEALLSRADRAFVEEDYAQAVGLYTQALEACPAGQGTASIHEARAHAYLKQDKFLEAAADATRAVEQDPSSWKALMRKGVACFHLEEYEAAKEAFEQGAKLAPDNAQFRTWARKCQAELDEEQGPGAQPPAPAPAPAPSTSQQAPPLPAAPAAPAQATGMPTASTAPQAAPDRKYRHQWYQLQAKVTVDVYAKGLKQEQVSVTFNEQHLDVALKDEGGTEDYRLDVDLYGKVKPAECKFEILKTKLEITLVKADNLQWASLERGSGAALAPAATSYSAAAPAPTTYPSSHKAKKDWDKVEAEVKELEQKGELEDGDPLNNFFKKIFSQGDENQRRAMMKSFQESNGTVLSTNWAEVGSKKVECTPPDGMEAKPWGP